MTYKASLDNLSRIITIALSFIFILAISAQVILFQKGGMTAPLITSAVLLLTYGIAFSIRPLGYTWTDKALIIQRPVKNVHIDRHTISHVEILDPSALKWTWRTFGVGGLFGYFGRFTNSSLGGMTWYATRRNDNAVLVVAGNKKIILTPDNPEQFVREFTSVI